MVLVRNFCCCCKLKTGTIMIGTISLIVTMGGFILLIHAIMDSPLPKEKNVLVGVAFVAFIILIASMLLIVGAAKEYMWFLLSWMVLTSVAMISIFVYATYYLAVNQTITKTGIIALDVLCIFGGTVLGIYILLVVFSLFMEIRKKEKGAEHGQHDACSPQK